MQKLLKLKPSSLSIACFSFYSCLQQYQAKRVYFNNWKYAWNFQTALYPLIPFFLFTFHYVISILSIGKMGLLKHH